jgi:dihydroorotase
MSRICIKSGHVVDPANKIDKVSDILIERGKIASVQEDIQCSGAEIIDASGMIVSPGLIDMHVHLREPGREDEETIASGTRAAAKGGFTSIACMPNTSPVADNTSVIEMILEKSREEGVVSVFPIAAITKGQKGEELVEMGDLSKVGVVGFSDDGKSVMNARVMRRAFEYHKMFAMPLILHAEDTDLSAGGQMNEGYHSTLLGLKGIPCASEEIMVERDLRLAGLTKSSLHITHISTKGTVDLIRAAKKSGMSVTCDVTPHHLVLTEEELTGYDTNYKVNPPLRSKADIDALKKGLADGTIDAIASDHAPHAQHEKEREFIYAPFGMIGLETTLPVVLSELVEKEKFPLAEVLGKLTSNPAQILGIAKGNLSPGSDADILIFDIRDKVRVDSAGFASKSRNCPFNGLELHGAVVHVFVGGKAVVKNGSIA